MRVLTCGSVDDGKSSLLGRLLYDAGLVPNDHLQQLRVESRGREAGPEGLDFSLLVDGLSAEREQGITIDVAYRYFSTARRAFVIADAPGHEQYTRNMVTGASTAQVALVLVDVRKGLGPQTCRHSLIAGLLGIRDVMLVVNKMDLVGWDEERFRVIEAAFTEVARRAAIKRVITVPVSALNGDNVVQPSGSAPWYTGPTVLAFLESIAVPPPDVSGPFCMPVQWINRATLDFRGIAGSVARGTVQVGDCVMVAGAAASSPIAYIRGLDGEQPKASAGEAVTLVLAHPIDVSRGDVLVHASEAGAPSDAFEATLIWLQDEPMIPGRSYVLRLGPSQTPASIAALKHKVDLHSSDKIAAKTLAPNEIGIVDVVTDRLIMMSPYLHSRELGGFILVDRLTNATAGAGLINFPLNRSNNIAWQAFDVTPERRAALKGQKAAIIWLTGLSGAGKSTIANIVDRKLTMIGRHTFIIDGDNVRHGLNRDLGFTDHDRVENIRRVAHMARLMADAGLIVIVSLVSPFKHERALAREIAKGVPFIEVFVDTPIDVCEERDPKGLYRKARLGQIRNFTGIGSAYEPPLKPDLHLIGVGTPPDALADQIIRAMGAP